MAGICSGFVTYHGYYADVVILILFTGEILTYKLRDQTSERRISQQNSTLSVVCCGEHEWLVTVKVGRIYSHSASAGLDLGSERACANTPAPAPHKQSPESTGARWLSLRTVDSPAPKTIYYSTFKLTLNCWNCKCFQVMERILKPAPLAYCFWTPPRPQYTIYASFSTLYS